MTLFATTFLYACQTEEQESVHTGKSKIEQKEDNKNVNQEEGLGNNSEKPTPGKEDNPGGTTPEQPGNNEPESPNVPEEETQPQNPNVSEGETQPQNPEQGNPPTSDETVYEELPNASLPKKNSNVFFICFTSCWCSHCPKTIASLTADKKKYGDYVLVLMHPRKNESYTLYSKDAEDYLAYMNQNGMK